MSNPILISESFEQAAYQLRDALDRFSTHEFEQSVHKFSRSVDKLQQLLGMQAENDQRKAIGHSMAYVEDDFLRIG